MKKDNVVIELINLKKYYGKMRGIEDVSLKINSGEVYGFIGPNGAGKSTTIRTLMGLINKTSGEIFINGKILDINDISVKKEIGYLPSEINLYDDITVREMLDYHESFYDKKVNKRRKELVNLFQIDESKKIEDLSLGNSKKVGIVLALMHSPKMLILDEATSGLDPIMQNVFFDLLLAEKKKGTTILYSTHVLSEISKICDRVGFIKDGKIIKEDNVSNLDKENITYLTINSDDIKSIKDALGLKVILEENNKIKFINNLNPDTLLKKLSKFKIDKLLIEEISIEDLFIEYYK